MATFKLDTSTLGGGQYRTVPFEMTGEFRDIQFEWTNSVANQDMEPHYLEIVFSIVGVDETLPV